MASWQDDTAGEVWGESGRGGGAMVAERTTMTDDPFVPGERSPTEEEALSRWERLWPSPDEASSEDTPLSLEPALRSRDSLTASRQSTASTIDANAQTPAESEGERANRQRLALLVRKYAEEKLSDEERVRLRMLTERVRALLPGVDASDFAMLDDMEARRIARRTRLEAAMKAAGIE